MKILINLAKVVKEINLVEEVVEKANIIITLNITRHTAMGIILYQSIYIQL